QFFQHVVELALDSSRRRRIRERLSSEVMTSQQRSKRPQPEGMGACQAGASVSRADRTRPLHSAAVGKGCWFFASPTSPSGRYRLVALPTPGDLFICAKDLFVDATTVWAATPPRPLPLRQRPRPLRRRAAGARALA